MCVNECTYVYECTNVCLLLYILHMYVCIFMYTCVDVMCMCTYVVHVCPFCTITLGFFNRHQGSILQHAQSDAAGAVAS